MSNFQKLALVCAVSTVILSACGGGTSTPSTLASVTVSSFPLQAGYKKLIVSGEVDNFTISGTCAGSATFSVSQPSSGTFEGATALSSTSTLTQNLTNCTPATFATTGTTYYDINYSPLGSSDSSVYAKFLTPLPAIPATVKIGDTAIYGTENLFTDSTKKTTSGQRTVSYVIETDGASTSTAIVNLISKDYNTSNQLTLTQQERYRIVADGTLSIVSIDAQASTTSTNHFLYTVK